MIRFKLIKFENCKCFKEFKTEFIIHSLEIILKLIYYN